MDEVKINLDAVPRVAYTSYFIRLEDAIHELLADSARAKELEEYKAAKEARECHCLV